MSPGATTIDHDATTSARNGEFVGIEVGGDRSCSVVIGSRLAAIKIAPVETHRVSKFSPSSAHLPLALVSGDA
jgi:hypothetical protein